MLLRATSLRKLPTPILHALVVFSLLFTAHPSISRALTPADYDFDGVPVTNSIHINVTTLGVGHLFLRFEAPAISMESVTANDRDWTLVKLDGEGRIWETGKPALPAVMRAVRMPNTGNVEVRIRNAQYQDYYNIDILPQQPFADVDATGNSLIPPFVYDDKTYLSDSWYPSNPYLLNNTAIMRDARISLFSYYPVQYQPSTRTLRVYTQYELEIIPVGGVGVNELLSSPKPVPSFASLYRDILGADDLVEDNLAATPGQILVIARSSTSTTAAFQSYIEWKTLSGHPVRLMAPANQGWSTSDVMSVIQTAYTTWNPPLESVILVGEGGSTMQSLYLPSYIVGENLATDHSYMQLAGDDILADVPLSRMSTSQISQLQTMISRTIGFEKAPPISDSIYFTTGWGYAGVSHEVLSNRPAVRFMLEMMNRRGVTNTRYDEHSSSVNYTTIQQATMHSILWAHRAAWVGELDPANFLTFMNTFRPFVSLNLTCGSGNWFGDQLTGINEALIRSGSSALPTGALSGMSTESSETKPAFNNVVATGVYYGFGVNDNTNPGSMYLAGKFNLWRNFQVSQADQVTNFSQWNNIMGDVTPLIWTGMPKRVTCTMPDTISRNATQMICNVTRNDEPLGKALVTAWKRNATGTNETYVRVTTDANGNAIIPLTNQTDGVMLISVTGNLPGQNIYPYVDSVRVLRQSVDLTVGTTIVNDSDTGTVGNGNGQLNPGETIRGAIQLTNSGDVALTNLNAAISSSDRRVTILDTSVSLASIGTGSSVTLPSIRLQVASTYSDGETVPLALNITTTQGSLKVYVNIPVRSFHLNLVTTHLINFPALEPQMISDFAVTVNNSGGWYPSSATSAVLYSLNREIRVTRSTTSFASLPNNVDVTNLATDRWEISTTSLLDPGLPASMMVVFSNGSIRDTIRFDIPVVGPSSSQPTGPDSYGYRAFDMNDIDYGQVPSYNWREIIDNSLGYRLDLHDDAYNRDSSVVVRLPFPVQYYGKRYDSLTICSNGWAAFGSQPMYNNFRNWHLPAAEGPRNLVAVFWEDLMFGTPTSGVYIYNDTASHRYVVTWRTQNTFGNMPNEFQLLIYQQENWPTLTGDAPLTFQYKDFNNITGDTYEPDFATIGIADNSRLSAIEYSYENLYTPGSSFIANNTGVNFAISFTTSPTDTMLHIYTPNGRDTLQVGSPYRFSWSGRPALATLHIELKRDFPNGVWERILRNVPNTGSATWTVAGNVSNHARFRLLSLDGIDSDTSKASVISSGTSTLALTNHDYLDWVIGDPVAINWDGAMLVGTVRIELNRDYPTGTWETIVPDAVSSTRTAVWTVTGPVTDHAQFRIFFNHLPTVGDTSSVVVISQPAHLIVDPNPINRTVSPADSTTSIITVTNDGGSPFVGTLSANCGVDGFTFIKSSEVGGPTYSWISNTSGTRVNQLVNGPYTLPFTFSLYGTAYTQMWIGYNGWLTFENPGANQALHQQQLPYTVMQSFLTPLWSHYQSGSGTVRYTFNRQYCLISWEGMQRYQMTGSSYTFEAMLYPDGSIVYQYQTAVEADTVCCSGVQSSDHTMYLNAIHREPVPTPSATKFYTSQRWSVPQLTSLSIPSGGQQQITVSWNARIRVLGDSLVGNYVFAGNENRVRLVVPVSMVVRTTDVANTMLQLPDRFALHPNYPNPFNPETMIRFDLAHSDLTSVKVFDVTGRLVSTLMNGKQIAGRHTIRFNGNRYAAGVYFVQVKSGPNTATQKIVLVK